MNKVDFLIIGAGIVGVSIARELKKRFRQAKIIILEKEDRIGLHSSGRNSGVIHSGIYYPADSLKAKICQQGAIEMSDYHHDNRLPINNIGKILVTLNDYDIAQLETLRKRAKLNGVKAEMIDTNQLREMEPEAHSVCGKSLYVPSTKVGDPGNTIIQLGKEIESHGIKILNQAYHIDFNVKEKKVLINNKEKIHYGHIINTAGFNADKIAHQYNIGKEYVIIPFRGKYWRVDESFSKKINHLIYPVPDLRMPFLGIHTTTLVDQTCYLGPTAFPAFGRVNYKGLEGIQAFEAVKIAKYIFNLFYQGNETGMHNLAMTEIKRSFKPWFVKSVQSMLPGIKSKHILKSNKVGIRAQVMNKNNGKLVNDFLVKKGDDSTHILNAISPAWTCAFPFARYICDNYIEK